MIRFLKIPINQKKEFVFEGDKPLGITRGIINAKDYFKNDFFIINADTIFLPKDINFLENAFLFHKKQNSLATFVVCELDSYHKKFKIDEKNNLVSAFENKGLHFTGYYILNEKIFDFLNPDRDLFECVLDAERCKCYKDNGLWFETGDIKSLTHTKNYLNKIKNSYLSNLLTYYNKI